LTALKHQNNLILKRYILFQASGNTLKYVIENLNIDEKKKEAGKR
jgi:hypothetical protein